MTQSFVKVVTVDGAASALMSVEMTAEPVDITMTERRYSAVFPTRRPPYVRLGRKIGRNDPCPCWSGKKYKKCCINK